MTLTTNLSELHSGAVNQVDSEFFELEKFLKEMRIRKMQKIRLTASILQMMEAQVILLTAATQMAKVLHGSIQTLRKAHLTHSLQDVTSRLFTDSLRTAS